MNYSYGSLHGGYFTHTGTVYQSGYAMKADSSEASHQPVNIKKEADKTPCSPTQENVPSLQREYQETIRQGTEKKNIELKSIYHRSIVFLFFVDYLFNTECN